MAHRGWWLAGVLAVVFACNSDKPSPFATKPSSASTAGSASSGSAASAASAGSASSGSAAGATGSAAVATASGNGAFKVGDAMWGLWGNGIAHPGKVLAVNGDGSYQVQWDDAGRNNHWLAADTSREKPTENPLKVGEKVWGLFEKGTGRGKIKRINADGSLWIVWDDYQMSDAKDWPVNSVSRNKPAPITVANDGGPALQVGDRVDGLWSDNRWYPAKVGAVNADGTYSINFDDGDKAAMDASHVRRRKASVGRASSAKAGDKPCWEGNRWTRCDPDHCFNLFTDDHNCGACGHECPKTARTCANGQCRCLSESYDSEGNCM